MATRAQIAAPMPKWAKVLFEAQWRYISLRGGRGSGKTKNIARALVLQAAQKPLRILCTREVQDSIKESVYAQLAAEIKELQLDGQFEVLRDEIRSKCGAVFIFKGLNDLSVGAVKSMANIDRCWIEEAQYLSKESWEKLDPTIRADGSQIILSWNPELETDFIYQEVVKRELPNCANLFINFDQNPWFPEELRIQEQTMKARDPIRHKHIWLGAPLPAVPNAIYFEEISLMEQEGRILNMTEAPDLNTYIFMDLGFNDHMTAGVTQKAAGEKRFIDYMENSRVSLKWFSDEFTLRGYTGAIIVLPHDGVHHSYQTALSSKDIMESYGWTVEVCDNIGVEEGIRRVRDQMGSWLMDKTRCELLIEHLKRYQRTKHGHPLHDEHSHASDMVRYAAVHDPYMTNSKGSWGGKLSYPKLAVS